MGSYRSKFLSYAALLVLASTTNGACQAGAAQQPLLASIPPMGWNSWDGYGTTIDEANFKANVDWFAKHLKPYGWQYVVIDMEWFVTNPVPEGNAKTFQYSMDNYGRYTPPAGRFPSVATDMGFKPLAEYVHVQGLKFGIHILRGIPKEAVRKNLPIEGSNYHASDAAITSDTCPWNFDNYGVNANTPAGAAYYDSIARLYASWQVDLIKVDCISSRPYQGDEIRLLREALDKTNRTIILSLSPGPAPREKTAEMRKYAQMWRISNDIWDLWHSTVDYPQGLGDQFANVAKWAGVAEPGHWPDADMLPVGYLGPAPGWGKPRQTQLSHDEQRTLVTLWSIFGSPLMVGGDLKSDDDWTTALLTNPEVIEVDQHSARSRLVVTSETTVVWRSMPSMGSGEYLAVFNVSPVAKQLHYEWKDLDLASRDYAIRDLWERKDLGSAKSFDLTLASHACALYRLSPQSSSGSAAPASSSNVIDFEDRPNFKVAGITDLTASGGHGSETRVRTGEELARDTLNLESREAAETAVKLPSATAKGGIAMETQLVAALKETPRGFEENHVLGEFYLHSQECREAIPFLQTAHQANPAHRANTLDLARALEACGELAQARETVSQMLTSEKNLSKEEDANLQRLLGDLDEKLEEPLAAVRAYERAAELDASEQNYFAWGAELLLHRAAAPAAEVFARGAHLHPESARMLAGLGASLYTSGFSEEAASRLCEASDLDPSNSAPYLFLGKIQEGASASLPCAEQKLARFANERPADALANYYYAMALWKRSRGSENSEALAKAEALLQNATAIDPKFDLANVQLGNIYLEQGALPKALAAYQQAVAANLAGSEAHYRLGLTYKRLGDESNAQREFAEYKKLQQAETATIERQRREVRQFLFVLENRAK
jgi:alpha-galactosidase